MAAKLNSKGKSHAIALINAGKVDKAGSWSFGADDENKILGKSEDWGEYEKWFLGIDSSAKVKTKEYYKYPFGKDGKVYRSALTAIRQRAGQQGATEIFDAAGILLEKVDKDSKKKADENALNIRAFTIPLNKQTGAPETLNEDTRSFEVVAATEEPCMVYDYERGPINEVLLMSGMQMPPNGQMVMLDSHMRGTTGSVIGSMRDMRVNNGQLPGRVYFSSVPEAQGPYTKAKEGHLTDFSLGYRVLESVWIPEGQSQVIEGRTFNGPLQVSTKSVPREVSIVAIGADPNAKARAEVQLEKQLSEINNQNVTKKEDSKMEITLRKMLEEKGLPATATDEEAVVFLGKLGIKEAKQPPTKEEEDTIRAAALGEEKKRITEIDDMCQRYDCADLARELIVGGKKVEEARQMILDAIVKKGKNPGYSGIEFVNSGENKFRAAAEDSLLLRASMKVEKPAPGANELRGFTLVELARECLRVAGKDHRGASKEMIGRALTSSDFPYILANLQTKSMQLAWDQQQETWSQWCGTGSVADFKTYYDNALSEHDDLEEIPNSGEIKMGAFSEKAPETYRAISYGKKFRTTRVMIINDDMNALMEMPARRAEAAARKVGDVAYAVLTANGNMGDGHAIFDATYHANVAISGYTGAPGIIPIAEAIRAIGIQKDIAGKRRLNIPAKFVIAPKALEGASEIFFRSGNFSDHNTVATDSSFASTRVNPYSGNYFTRVYEARLDDVSEVAWYVAGPKGRTVKVVFLNGVQAPIMEMRQPGFTIEGFEYMVAIDAGAYAMDYRGLYYNAGA